MKLRRALKIRLYPTLEPVIFLNKMLGCCRFLYNHMLAEWIQVYEALKEEKKEKSCERKRNRRGNLLEEKEEKAVNESGTAVAISLRKKEKRVSCGEAVQAASLIL